MHASETVLWRYKALVITQILLLALGLTLSDVLFLASGQRIYTILIPLFLIMGGLYLALLYKVLEVHAVSRTFKLTCFWLLSAVLIASILVENPFFKPFEAYQRTYVLLGIHISIFMVELLVIVLSLKLVLSKTSLSMMTRLWATCAIYFLMAIAFASLYDLMNIIRPDSFGEVLIPGFKSYAESMYFSLNSMVKLENRYSELKHYAKAVSVIQAVWNDLFVALLVGNILAKRK